MRFAFPAITLALLVTLPLHGGDDGLSGLWKFSIFEAGQQTSFWIVKIESKDNKLAITTEPLKGAPIVEVKDIKMAGDTFAFSMHGHVTQMKERSSCNSISKASCRSPAPSASLVRSRFRATQGRRFLRRRRRRTASNSNATPS